MTELTKLARKLERVGFGVKILDDGLIVLWESWEPECVKILKAKTYKDALAKRNKQIEERYGVKLVSSCFKKGKLGHSKISESVFSMGD